MSRITDLFRVIQGVNMVTRASYQQWHKHNRYATSSLTLYPSSPLHEASHALKSTTQSIHNVISLATTTTNPTTTTQQQQQQSTSTIINNNNNEQQFTMTSSSPPASSSSEEPLIFYNTFGNTTTTDMNNHDANIQQQPSHEHPESITVDHSPTFVSLRDTNQVHNERVDLMNEMQSSGLTSETTTSLPNNDTDADMMSSSSSSTKTMTRMTRTTKTTTTAATATTGLFQMSEATPYDPSTFSDPIFNQFVPPEFNDQQQQVRSSTSYTTFSAAVPPPPPTTTTTVQQQPLSSTVTSNTAAATTAAVAAAVETTTTTTVIEQASSTINNNNSNNKKQSPFESNNTSNNNNKPTTTTATTTRVLRERAVPSSSFGRAVQFSGLGAQLIYGTVSEAFRRNFFNSSTSSSESSLTSSGGDANSSVFVNEQNAQALADALCKMRGAALKLGQMLSIQDESMVPPVIQKALERVRHSADIMPRKQLEQVLREELGEQWRDQFLEFEMQPMAAASIGQVHRGVLKKDGREVAVKIQYPGVANSIDSDIRNVKRIVDYTNLIPKGAFINDTMNQARKELQMECDYEREAECQRRFKSLLQEAVEEERQRIQKEGSASQFEPPMSAFHVPDVIDELSTKRILTTEMIHGFSIDNLSTADVDTRNYVARSILKLCLKELFEFRFMQTDPNWSNFFYDPNTGKINLIDFGACLEFPKHFIDQYIRVVHASATKDQDTVIDASIKMGFLTGDETQVMFDAHAKAAMLVGEPFSREGIFDFKGHAMPEKVSAVLPTMLKHRLTPPPPVTYSLHRKLSGAFLLCYKLNASIACRDIFMDVYKRYHSDLKPDHK